MTSDAVVFGFNVRADRGRRLVEQEGVDLRYYNVIYDLIDDVKQALTGMLAPEMREEILGIAEVRDVFRSPKFGQIAGCMVTEGTVYRSRPIRVLRDNVVIYEGELESLRRFKDDASEVRNGMECGIGVKNYNDVKVGDQIEVFEVRRSRAASDRGLLRPSSWQGNSAAGSALRTTCSGNWRLLIQRELRDPRLGMVSMTAVEVSRDLAHARVYFTLLGCDSPRRRRPSIDVLNGAAGFLRSSLSRKRHHAQRAAPAFRLRQQRRAAVATSRR
jgi:ribosome-binding factor A